MSTIAWSTPRLLARPAATTALNAAARFWFVAAVVGQWAFFAYIAAFYGPSTLTGNFEAWGRNPFLPKGYVPGDTVGNLSFAAHALLAGITSFGGALQLIPRLRQRIPALHRWNGRLFMITALGVSVTGLYMVWFRGTRTGSLNTVAISLNAVLIIALCIIAWRKVMTGDLAAHRHWAMRAYLVANGQWFMRVGMIGWMMLTGAREFNDAAAFANVWVFGCYLVPLAALELYLRVSVRGGTPVRFAVAATIVLLTLFMSAGTAGLSMFLWKLLTA